MPDSAEADVFPASPPTPFGGPVPYLGTQSHSFSLATLPTNDEGFPSHNSPRFFADNHLDLLRVRGRLPPSKDPRYAEFSASVLDVLDGVYRTYPHVSVPKMRDVGVSVTRSLSSFTHQSDFVSSLSSFTESMRDFAGSDPQTSRALKWAEAGLILVAQLARSSGAADVFLALAAFRGQLAVGSVLEMDFSWVEPYFRDCFQYGTTDNGNEFVHQSLDFEDLELFTECFRKGVNFVGGLNELPIMKKMHKFLMCVLCRSTLTSFGMTFDACGYSKFEEAAIRQHHSSKATFVFALFDCLSLFCRQFVRSVKIGTFEPFYHSSLTYEKWVDEVYDLKRKALVLANPAPHGFDIFDFRGKLRDAIEHGESIVKNAAFSTDMEKNKIKTLLGELRMIKARDITKRSAQATRPAPASLLLAGGSCLGKSILIDIIRDYTADILGLSNDPTYTYTRNCAEKHWNGFTSSVWCIVLDDIAALNPQYGAEDSSLSDIISVINNTTCVPEQAALEDKGVAPVLAKLVIATTNSPDLNAHAYYASSLAVRRRFPWVVTVRLKPQFATSGMLDGTKLTRTPGEFPNYWDFDVSKVINADEKRTVRQMADLKVIHVFDDISQLLAWWGVTVTQHEANQASVTTCATEMKTIESCKLCFRPKYSCSCCLACHLPDYQCLCRRTAPQFVGMEHQAAVETFHSQTAHVNATPGAAWSYADSRDLTYTLCTFFVCVGYSFLLQGFGGLAIWLGFTSWYRNFLEYGVDWEGRFMRFFIRRIGAATQKRFAPILNLGKMFACVGAALVVSNSIWHAILPAPKAPVADPVVDAAEAEKQAHLNAVPSCCREALANGDSKCGGCGWDEKAPPISQCGDFEAQALEDVGAAPTPLPNERPSVWKNMDMVNTKFDVGPATCSNADMPLSAAMAKVKLSCVRARISVDGSTWKNTGLLAIKGNLYAINTHALVGSNMWIIELNFPTKNAGVSPSVRTLLARSQVFTVPNSDVTFICTKAIPPAPGVIQFLPEKSFGGQFVGHYVGYHYDGSGLSIPVSDLHQTTYDGPDLNGPVWVGKVTSLTSVGDCGAPLLVMSSLGPVIVGIHSLGSPGGGVIAVKVTRDMVATATAALLPTQFISVAPNLNAPNAPLREVLPLSTKSPLRWLEDGSAKVYGTMSGHRSEPHSRVVRSFIAAEAEKEGYVQTCGPPVMKGWMLWSHTLKDITNIPHTFRQDLVDHCVESFATEILALLPRDELASIKVYDLRTAINGVPSVPFVDGVNRGTSAGPPWGGPKRQFLISDGPTVELPDAVTITQEVKDRITDNLARYARHELVMPLYRAHLKDEPTPFAKIEAEKTRAIAGTGMDQVILVRMYSLAVVRVMMRNRYIFESAPGTIAQSREWGDLRDYLTHFGEDQIVAGDYKAFDKTMPAQFILAAFDIFVKLAEAAGWASEDINVLQGIALDTAYPLYDLNGDVIQTYGSNPSGHSLTTPINGLANALYMRYCYTVLNPEHNCTDFKSNVRLATYGDDNAMGVSALTPWFNHTSIQATLANQGVTYTMADKESASRPYIHIDEVSFLKRTWRWDPDVGEYLPPLERKSIERSLMTNVRSSSLSPEYQSIYAMESAICEYFFYGREEFEASKAKLMRIAAKTGIMALDHSFDKLSWEYLKERFLATPLLRGWREQLKAEQ